jgi:tape measure domain-containing protein
VSDIIVNLDINNTGFNIKIRNAERLLNQLGRNLRDTETAARNSSRGFNSLTSSLRDISVIGYGVAGAFQTMNAMFFGWQHSIIKASAEIEKLTILLTGLSDAQTQFAKNYDAHNNLKEMITLAKEAPFAMNEMMKSFVKFQSVKLDDPKRMVQALADAIAAFGGGNDEFHRASVAITQMAGKGVISMEELRQQLGEAVPSAISVMAKKLGMSYGELVEVVSSGSLSARKGLTALTEGFEEDFGGMAKKMMETWSGMTSQLQTNWMMFKDQIGRGGLFDESKQFLADINKALTDPEVLAWADHFGERLGVMTDRLNQAFNWLVEHRNEVEKLIDVSVTLFAIWLGEKGLKGIVGLLKPTLNIIKMLPGPLKAVTAALAAISASWVYLTGGVDEAGKKIGIFDRLSRDIDNVMQSDLLIGWRVLWDDLTAAIGGTWDKLYEGSSKYLPIVNEAIKNNTSVLDEFIQRIKDADKNGSYFENLSEAWSKSLDPSQTEGFADIFGALFDAIIVEAGAELADLFLSDVPAWIEDGLRTLPARIKSAVADAKVGMFSLLSQANDTFYSNTNEYDSIDAALSAEQSAARLASAMATIEMAVKTAEKSTEDAIENTNKSITKAFELREKLIKRIKDTGNNLNQSDLEDQRQYFEWGDRLWAQHEDLLGRFEQAEIDQAEIIREATDEQMAAYEDRRVGLINKIQEIVDETDSINLDVADQSGVASPDQIARLNELNVALSSAQEKMTETEAAQRALAEASADSVNLAPEQRLQYDALSRIMELLKVGVESAGNALGEFNDKAKDGIEDIKILSPELRKAQNDYAAFAGAAEKILRDATPGGKELAAIKAFEEEYVHFVSSIPEMLKSGDTTQELIDKQIQAYHNARAVLVGDYSDALDRVAKKQQKLNDEKLKSLDIDASELDNLANITGKRFDMIKMLDLQTEAYERQVAVRKELEKQASQAAATSATGYSGSMSSDYASQAASAMKLSSAVEQRMQQYLPIVEKYAKQFNVDRELILAVIKAESKFDPNAVSSAGAQGLMQLMPDTARGLGVTNSFDPDQNIMGGTKYLRQLLDQYNGEVEKTLMGYNAGPGNVKKYNGNVPFEETQNYIKKIIPDYNALKQVVGDTSESQDGFNATMSAGLDVMGSQANAMEGQVNAVGNLYKSLDTLESKKAELLLLEERELSLANEIQAMKEVELAQGYLSEEQADRLSHLQGQLANTQAEIGNIREDAIEQEKEQIANGELYVKVLKLEKGELDSLSESYGTRESARRSFNTTVAELNMLLASGKMQWDEYARAMKDAEQTLRSAQGPFQAWIVDLEKAIPSFEEFTVDVMDSFVDTLVDGLSEGKLEFSSFVDDVKKMLARIAINKIVVSVLGNVGLGGVSGVTGTAGTVAGAAGSLGSLSNLTSLLSLSGLKSGLSGAWDSVKSGLSWLSGGSPSTSTSNIYGAPGYGSSGGATINWGNLGAGLLGGTAGSFIADSLFDGDYVSIGSTIGSAAGTAMGTTLATAMSVAGPVGTAIGALIGSVAGGGLASLFGDSEPEFGGYQMSFSGLGFEENVKSKGAFGLSFGATGTGTTNMDMSEYQDIFDGFAGMTNVLADFYGSDLEEQVKNAIWSQIGDYKKLSKDTSEALSQVFTMISEEAVKAEQDLDGPAHALNAVIEASGGLTALGDSAEDMTKVIQGGIEIATYSAKLFNTEIGKLMGMGLDREFDSVVDSAKAMTWYVQAFWKEGETSASMIERFSTNLSALNTAVMLTQTNLDGATNALEQLGFSALQLMIIAEDLADTVTEAGLTMEDFATLQSAYYEAAYSEAERAQHQADAARRAIADWNDEMGFAGDSYIDSLSELRSYLEGLDEYSEDYNELYVSAIKASGSFVSLEEALEALSGAADDASMSIEEFMKAITPESILNAQAIQEALDLFNELGLTMPSTSEALYEMIQAGLISDEQLARLAENADTLFDAWSAIGDVQDDLIDKLTDAYNDAVDVAQERSDALIEQMQEQSEAYLDALEEEYEAKVDAINETLEALEEWRDVVASVSDALESLTQQLEGSSPDMTRQRYLAMAEDAIAQYQSTGELPNNIQDIISGLGQVEQQDFASFADWEAAIGQNMDVLNRLVELSGYSSEEELETQIEYWEEQLEQERELYEQAKEDEEDRLDRAIEAEEERLERELAALEAKFDETKLSIENASLEELLAMAEQTDWLEQIFQAILDANAPGTPDSPGTGSGADTWNDLPGGTPESERGRIWKQIQDIISGGGTEALPMPEIGSPEDNFKDAYDKLSRLLKDWKGLGLVSDAERQSVIDLLKGLGITVPGFATGGIHTGGLRIVGERGPELEYTGPSSIASNNSIDTIFKAGNADLADEIRALRSEVQSLKTVAMSQATSSAELTRIHKRWDGGGLPPDRMDYFKTLADEAVSA